MERILGKDKGAIKRFFYMLWKAKLPYLWIIVYIFISVGLTNVGISVTEYTAEMFAGNVDTIAVILPFLLVTILSLLISSVSFIISNLCVAIIDRNFRRMIWAKIVKLPLSFFYKNSSKELISRITTDVTAVSYLIMAVFVDIVTNCYTLFAIFQKISTYDTKLMFSLLAILPLNILIAFVVGKFEFGIRDNVSKANAQLTGHISKHMSHFMQMKTYGKEDQEEQASKRMKGLYRSNILNSWMRLSTPLYTLANMMQFIIIVMVGRHFYASGALSLTQWIAYFGFSTSIANALTAYCDYWSTFKETQGAVNRVSCIMEETEENIYKGKTVETLSGDIILENVSFTYGTQALFKDMNLTIPKGKVTAIVGPSGSGKTTLLNIVERMYPVQSGAIYFGNEKIEEYSLKSFREKIAYITQGVIMFSGSIRENLLFGLDSDIGDELLKKVCGQVGLLDFISEEQGGLSRNVGEGGSFLSEGQKQRLAIAKAILKDADYIFMDEATSVMDFRNRERIWQGLQGKNKDKTIIMVAHDRETVQRADYVIVMKEGRIEAAGDRESIQNSNGYYRRLLGKER